MEFTDSFRAMDTDVDVSVEAQSPPADAFASIRLLFEEQEARFSRFRPASLLSRLNRGETVRDPLLARACGLALEGHRFTGGLFNPMVLPALVEAGYGRTLGEVMSGKPRRQPIPDPADCLAIEDDAVTLRQGALDLGGIVKGWTVDLAFASLEDRYPDLLLNAGGDLRCAGRERGLEGWALTVAPPGGGPSLWEGVMQGALATSTTRKRQWRTASGTKAHHLIDPRTGLPAQSSFEQVSAWAAQAWVAEVVAKAILVGGREAVAGVQLAAERALAVDLQGRPEWLFRED